MKIVVHAGMHKTGTSTIQNAYASSNLENLDYFPWDGPNHTGLFIALFEEEQEMPNFHGFRIMGRSLEEMKNLRNKWKVTTEDFIKKSNANTFLFSAEAISGNHRTAVENFARFCFEKFDEVQVILYVRHPLSFMASSFQEQIKAGSVDNLNLQNIWPFYRDKISLLDEFFGEKNIILRVFDPDHFHQGDLISDFAHSANIPLPNGKIERTNESLSLEAVAALYTQRSLGDGFVLGTENVFEKNAEFVKSLSTLGSTPFSFSPELLDIANNQYKGDYDWLKTRMKQDFLYPGKKKSQRDISCEQDLYNLTLGLALPINLLYEERKSVMDKVNLPDNSINGLAEKLSVIRQSFYINVSKAGSAQAFPAPKEKIMATSVKIKDSAADNERDARMKLAYAVLWAQERAEHGAGNSDIQAKWSDEMADRTLEAAQIMFMLKEQGFELKSLT